MSPEPLISIVTPAYNAEKYIAQTIESVLAQTYQNWEMLIVVDSKSNDNTVEVAQQASRQDPRIEIFTNHACQGVTQNRNFAIDRAKGSYIAFLDADDLWLPNKLERQVQFSVAQKVDFSFHSYTPIDQDGTPKGKIRVAKEPATYSTLLRNNTIGCLTVLLRKEFLGTRRFKESPHEDFALWLELLRDGTKAIPLNENLALYRIVQGSRSNNKLLAAISRYKVLSDEPISLWQRIAYMGTYALSSLAKRI